MKPKRRWLLFVALVAGVGTAISLPPMDRWWAAPLGYALFAATLLDATLKPRLARAGAFTLGFFAVSLAWMVEFSLLGMVLLVLLEAAIVTAVVVVVPRAPSATIVAFPAALALGEALRYRFPLGGLPMAGPALGQADGPLLPIARVGGDYAIVFVVALFGAGLCGVVVGLRTRAPGLRRTGVAALVVGLVVTGAAAAVHAPAAKEPIRVAYVQGGGVRGLRAVDNEATDTYANQREASKLLKGSVDLVVWPEDVIDLAARSQNDSIRFEVGALATRLQTPRSWRAWSRTSGADRFRNAAVAWDRSGKIVDRYDKVHRVPFGEYVPARGLVSHLADISAVPRDAIAGQGRRGLLTRAGDLGVLISYEVFFAERARAAVHAGGEILLVPTNASSFKGRQVPRRRSPPPGCGPSRPAATSSRPRRRVQRVRRRQRHTCRNLSKLGARAAATYDPAQAPRDDAV